MCSRTCSTHRYGVCALTVALMVWLILGHAVMLAAHDAEQNMLGFSTAYLCCTVRQQTDPATTETNNCAVPVLRLPCLQIELGLYTGDVITIGCYVIIVGVLAPLWEEVLFRGFLLPSLAK